MIFFNRNFIFMLFLNRNIIVIIFFNRKLVVPQMMLGSTKSRTYLLSVHSEQRYGRYRTNDLCISTLLTLVRFGGAWWLVRVGRACSEIMFAFIYNDNFRINNVREGFRYEICYVYNIYYLLPAFAKLSQMPESRLALVGKSFPYNGDNKASKIGKQYGSQVILCL